MHVQISEKDFFRKKIVSNYGILLKSVKKWEIIFPFSENVGQKSILSFRKKIKLAALGIFWEEKTSFHFSEINL